MLLSQSIPSLDGGPDILLIVRTEDRPRPAGKYILGRDLADPRRLVAVLDDSAGFHVHLAQQYGLRPLGGGWCEIDHAARRIVLSDRSTQFGREPDRHLTVRLFSAAFPGYHCWHED
ncbi:MAG: hypothetical protein HY821_07300 [Acidobacteria bacterium]|nr:hypothetical protein [Acidobacteriota bacterium]